MDEVRERNIPLDEVDADDAPDAADEACAALSIRAPLLKEILTAGFKSGTKISPAAQQLSSVLVHAFINEAWHRAAAEAEASHAESVDAEHLEKIMPQLLLDFGP